MRYLCRMITPPKGIVFDPFTGSGTTGVAAIQEGFGFTGIERELDYYALAHQRLLDTKPIQTNSVAFSA
jgi:DNA modification methylase